MIKFLLQERERPPYVELLVMVNLALSRER